ncbi:Protein CBG13706 [Caenorhabditis briggsae]|uniref:Protein CBG13706 n=1 Tax=Caenorhabditis briggsae TaxID=6238 RepID=A8XII6_CAEBR|nr:Protein CBG13706 [Caenorhabditis briggsae]CAP32460.2 Protein CBG13706 [Caenorhabditis briggsae]
MSSPIFTTNEIFVCLHEKDGSKFPYSAKIMAIKEIGSIQFYMIHYRGWKSTTDIRFPVGEEAGRMYKGSLKEYGEKFHVDISPDAWDAEKKCKRKAVDDLERSFVKKERIQEENVYRKVYVAKRRKLREDSEEATSSDALRRSRGDPGATTSEVKDSRISKDQENNFEQQNPKEQIRKIPKMIPIDQIEEVQNQTPSKPDAQFHETQICMDQPKGAIPNVLEEIQNLLESPEKNGPIEKVTDSEVASKIQDKDDKVEIPVSEEAIQKPRNNPGYYIPKNDPVYNERMSVLRARHAGTLDEVKLTDGLGKILVDDHKLVHSERKVPKMPTEWTVVKILEEVRSFNRAHLHLPLFQYKNSKDHDADSYDINVLNSMVPSYMDKHIRSLLYTFEIPRYEQRVLQKAEDITNIDPKSTKPPNTVDLFIFSAHHENSHIRHDV